MIFRLFITIIIITLSNSCDIRREGPQKEFKKELANASPDFREGWTSGCEVGNATGGKTFYRMFAKNNKIDGWKMANSQDYKIAWTYGFWFCYRDDHVDQKSTGVKSFFGGMQ
jgi:hypothetical protein